MMPPTRIATAACLVVLLPIAAVAQTTVDGSGEWTVSNHTTTSNDQSSANGAFSQNYSLGYGSSLWSPRLLRFNAAGLFRTNSLTSRSDTRDEQRGRQADVGYRFGASLLPSSSMPFFLQASRTTSNSSGDLGPSNPIRSGMIAPSGAPPVDFESRNKSMTLGWRLGFGALPLVDLGYRSGETIVSGGSYLAEQRDEDLSATVSKDTARMHHALRYQRTSAETVLADTFLQDLTNLDYDHGTWLTRHTRVTAHVGRRRTFIRSDAVSIAPDPGDDPYAPPPSFGAASAEYAQAGVAYEPSGRFTIRVDGTVDRQTGGTSETRARLATLASHVEVVRGLRLSASGTAGTREQVVTNAPVAVATRGAVMGLTYQASAGWLSGNVSVRRGLGLNETVDGRRGRSASWSRDASLSARARWLNLSGGYEQTHNGDDLLAYGNLDTERVRASAQLDARRFSFTTTGEQARVRRGSATDADRHLQRTLSVTSSLRLWRDATLSTSAGAFSNRYVSEAVGTGRDRTVFWNIGGQAAVSGALRLVGWIRHETATAASTGFEQQAFNAWLRADYRLRTLVLSVEFRHNRSLTQYVAAPDPDHFDGRQVRFSVLRQFGRRLR